MRFEPKVIVEFDRSDRAYAPGAEMLVRYRVEGIGDASLVAVERSVLWYTEGKGEEDLGVHFFDRISTGPAGRGDASQQLDESAFTAILPASPLSYEGVIVKVRWCVRVRIFFAPRSIASGVIRDAAVEFLGSGRDFVSEHVFEMGTIPPAVGVSGAQSA